MTLFLTILAYFGIIFGVFLAVLLVLANFFDIKDNKQAAWVFLMAIITTWCLWAMWYLKV